MQVWSWFLDYRPCSQGTKCQQDIASISTSPLNFCAKLAEMVKLCDLTAGPTRGVSKLNSIVVEGTGVQLLYVYSGGLTAREIPSLSAILTSSASDRAPIFRIT